MAPKPSWRNSGNSAQVTNWNIGTVDAGTTSENTTFLIFNNYNESTAVEDMTDCVITTKDSAGGDTGALVLNTWVKVRVDSMGESGFTPIGGTVTKAIKAEGAAAGVISGAANTGQLTNTANYARVTLNATPQADAAAGNVNFLTRVLYRYT